MSEQNQSAPVDILRKILSDELPLSEAQSAVESCIKTKPDAALSLLFILLDQKHQCHAMIEESKKANAALMNTLREPPWQPVAFIRLLNRGTRALVAGGGRR